MNIIYSIILIGTVVGFITAGLKIRFDRFFTIILLLSLLKLSIFQAVNVFLWVLLFGTAYVLLENKDKIKEMPRQNRQKFLTVVPLLTFLGVFSGTYLFASLPQQVLVVILAILAFLYGLRLLFIHFKPHEFEYQNERAIFLKICGMIGPVVSGFFVGMIGTSLKPLKIPFAVRLGRMSMGQVYLGNTITAFYASLFAILLHSFYAVSNKMTLNNFLLGAGIWIVIHFVYETTNLFFQDRFRKKFQILIGAILILVSFKFL